MINEEHLNRYARLLVEKGAGLQEGQELAIRGEVVHREFALRVAEAAYDLGASNVLIHLKDPRMQAQLIRRGRTEYIDLYHDENRRKLNDIARRRFPVISLSGEENPRLMPELAKTHREQHRLFNSAAGDAAHGLRAHGINRGLCAWVVAGCPTEGWAKLVFPDLDPQEALERLWEQIFIFTFADQGNASELMDERDRALHTRRGLLNKLEIREIHAIGGKTDLRVTLSPEVYWLGGSKETVDGQRFNANVPSLENFTTPDGRKTEGRLAATMPFRTKSGLLVKDLVMEFRDGRVVEMDASEGKEGFAQWIDSDEGASRLGEFALVGADSPIAQSEIFFEHTLYDENAFAHAALGNGYSAGIRGGQAMSASELEAVGCNQSTIHTDIMFGSSEVSIIATKTKEGEVTLIENGAWTERFRG